LQRKPKSSCLLDSYEIVLELTCFYDSTVLTGTNFLGALLPFFLKFLYGYQLSTSRILRKFFAIYFLLSDNYTNTNAILIRA